MYSSFLPLSLPLPVFLLYALLLFLCKSLILVRLAHIHWWYTPLRSSLSPHFLLFPLIRHDYP